MHARVRWMLVAALLCAGCQSAGPAAETQPAVKRLRVNGADFAYVEQGAGVTVLFVHGALGDWRTWDSFRGYVAPKHRFVSMSRRYHYPNTWPDDGRSYTFDQHVDDVAAFIRALNVGKVHLIGSSWSGRLAGVLASKHPELLHSVVLGEPGLIAPTSPEGKAALASFMVDIGKVAAAAKAGDDRQAAVLLANAVLDDPAGFEKLPAGRQQRLLDNAKTVAPMFAAPPASPVLCEQLQALKVPVLAVRGERTRDAYRHGHDALLACLPPQTRQAIVPAATHFWGPDNPEAAAKAVLAFISGS